MENASKNAGEMIQKYVIFLQKSMLPQKLTAFSSDSKFCTTDSAKPPLLASWLKLLLVLPLAKTSRLYMSFVIADTGFKSVHINT